MSEDTALTEGQALGTHAQASASEPRLSGMRPIRAIFVTAEQRIQGYVSTESDRLVDHLNRLYPAGVLTIDGATSTPISVPEIIFAAPDDVAEPPAFNVRAWVKKNWQTVHAGLGRYVIVGNIYLPAGSSVPNAPLDPDSLLPFVVMKNAVIHDLKALGTDERFEVLLVNSRRIDYIIRSL